MKDIPSISFRGLVLVSAAIALAPLLTYAGSPIPGLDVKLGKNPGGIIAKATTDKDGKFVFDNLATGNYVLSAALPQTKTLISTTRSNIRHNIRLESGVQVVTATITLRTGPASDEIAITAIHGKIAGVVTRADDPKPTDAKPARNAKPSK